MRRFLTLVFLLFVALPAGITITGCYRNPAGNYCNGLGYGAKVTDLYTITLQPQNTGISMAWGQTRQISAPTAATCKGGSVSVSSYTYGTTNNQLVDISPTGNICAGTWNRNSGGGIADYTICNYPSQSQSLTNKLPYNSAYITATAQSVVSNPVQVYVHAPVTSISLVSSTPSTQCVSQGQTAQLDSEACYAGTNNTQYELCAPASVVASQKYACPGGANGATIPTCAAAIGPLTYTAQNTTIATINPETNQITAELPGTTVINASVAQSGSSAGYFSTCPPRAISVTLNGNTAGTVTQGVTQNLVTTVYDTNETACPPLGCQITGLTLDYQSTNPQNLSVSSSGAITASFPGAASVYAVCQPGTCNPAPINEIGANGTGLSIASNPVDLNVPGTASAYMWFGAPGHSQYFVPVELLTGTIGSTVRLPYVPNSMMMDQTGTNLYFGSSQGLMTYSTNSNSLVSSNSATPGVVLAVAPNNTAVLVNDQQRQVFYLVTPAASATSTSTTTSTTTTTAAASTTFGGMGTAAQFTPDGKTLYITDTASAGAGHSNTLYVYNANTGWTSCSATDATCAGHFAGAANLTVTIPGVGAYFSGTNNTVARTWCPKGTLGNYAGMTFYPEGDAVNTPTDVLTATTDGKHILGAAAANGGISFSDIAVSIPSNACPASTTGSAISLGAFPITSSFTNTTFAVNATSVNQVVTSPAAVTQTSSTAASAFSLSFVTYNGSTANAQLPYYEQTTGTPKGLGTPGLLTLNGSASITAPVAGAFSPDNTLFFVSTSGDNKIHYINTSTLQDVQQISPNLPACNPTTDQGCTLPAGSTGVVPATVITVKPRSTT